MLHYFAIRLDVMNDQVAAFIAPTSFAFIPVPVKDFCPPFAVFCTCPYSVVEVGYATSPLVIVWASKLWIRFTKQRIEQPISAVVWILWPFLALGLFSSSFFGLPPHPGFAINADFLTVVLEPDLDAIFCFDGFFRFANATRISFIPKTMAFCRILFFTLVPFYSTYEHTKEY